MSGKKGHSGRRPYIARSEKDAIIRKAWNKVNYKLGMSDAQSYGIAKDIAVKDMVSKEQVDMQAEITSQERSILDKYAPVNRLSTSDTN